MFKNDLLEKRTYSDCLLVTVFGRLQMLHLLCRQLNYLRGERQKCVNCVCDNDNLTLNSVLRGAGSMPNTRTGFSFRPHHEKSLCCLQENAVSYKLICLC